MPTAPTVRTRQYKNPTSASNLVGQQQAENRAVQDTNIEKLNPNQYNAFGSTEYDDGQVSRSLSAPLSGNLSGIYGGFGNALQGYGQLAGTQNQAGQFSRDVEQGILADMMQGLSGDERDLRQSQDAKMAAMGIAVDPRSEAYSRGSRALEDQIARNRANMRLGARGQAVAEEQFGQGQALQSQMAGLAGLGSLSSPTIQGALQQNYMPAGFTGTALQGTNIGGLYGQQEGLAGQRQRDIWNAQNQQYSNQLQQYNAEQAASPWNSIGDIGLGIAGLGMSGGGTLGGAGLSMLGNSLWGK